MTIRDPHTVPPQGGVTYTFAAPVDLWNSGHPVIYDEDFWAAAAFLEAHHDAYEERLYSRCSARSYTPQGLERERRLSDADAILLNRLRRMWLSRDRGQQALAWDLIRLATLPYEDLEVEVDKRGGCRPCPPFDPAWREVLRALKVEGRG